MICNENDSTFTWQEMCIAVIVSIILGVTVTILAVAIAESMAHADELPAHYKTAQEIMAHKKIDGKRKFTYLGDRVFYKLKESNGAKGAGPAHFREVTLEMDTKEFALSPSLEAFLSTHPLPPPPPRDYAREPKMTMDSFQPWVSQEERASWFIQGKQGNIK